MKVIRPSDITAFTSSAPLDAPLWSQGVAVTVGERYIHDNYIWEVLTEHTTNTAPNAEDTAWLKIGPSNPYAMFDNSVGTKTVSEDGVIEVTIEAGRVDSVALLELEATNIEVILTVDGNVEFSASADLVNRNSTGSWLGFFTEPLYQQDFYVVQGMVDTAVLDLPKYLGAALTIRITNTGGPVSCGVCRPGLVLNIGETGNGAETGIEDYSLREFDEWGRVSQVARSYAKEISTEVHIYTDQIDFVYGWLVKLKDTPLVWLGIEQHSSYVVYGFGKWRISRKGSVMSTISLDIEGLV